MVDEHAGQLVADRLVDQDRRDRTVDAARQAADHLARSDLLADFGDLGFAIGGHRPVALQPAHAMDEVGDQLGAVGGMRDFGVELGAVELPLLVGDHREWRTVADRDDLEARREGGDLVAVAHPHLVPLADRPQPVEQRAFLGDGDEGAAELALPFALVAGLDPAAQLVAHHLLAVADAEDRKPGFEQLLRRARAALFRHAGGRARQDDAFGLHPLIGGQALAERGDLAINAGLAHPARDQLRHLAAEVDDKDGIGRLHGGPIAHDRPSIRERLHCKRELMSKRARMPASLAQRGLTSRDLLP